MKKLDLQSPKKLLGAFIARVSKGGFSIPLSAPAAIILALILVCAIGWAFFMGYMVGKGRNPEESLQEIAGISRTTEPDEPEAKAAIEEPAVMPESGQIPLPSPEIREPAQFTRPEGRENDAWESDRTKPGPREAVRQPAKKNATQPARTTQEKFNFTYQAAAFRTKQEADALKARLDKAGVRAQTRKDGKVFLVLATLRGTDQEALNLRKKLQGMKLGNPLLLAKKPVGQARSAKK